MSINEGKWLVVSFAEDEMRVAVNLDEVSYIEETEDGCAMINLRQGLSICTKETFDEIGAKIR